MLLSLLLLGVGLAVLTAGAELLVRGASNLALRCGLSPLVVGLTVVAFGTSAPELAVSLKAALAGRSDMAVGNIVGSNIFNVAVILGIAAVFNPLHVHLQVIRREMPIMLAVSMLFPILVKNDGGLHRYEAGFLFAGIILYTALSVRLSRREFSRSEDAKVAGTPPGRLELAIGLVIAGLALLTAGARLMVDHAAVLAKLWGVSEAVIGLTVVAAGTSMPELATSVVAALRKQTDIAVGNAVGSNIFNVLSIGGATGLIAPPLTSSGVTWLDYGFMIAAAMLLLPLMRTGFVINRWEGMTLLASYGLYLYLIWPV